ncbi:MAG: Snf7 family protein [Candidatus Lokiarchaeota archaeon]
MGLKDRLFPKKGKDKDVFVTKAKSHLRKLDLINRNYSKKASISYKNAKIALQRKERQRAKNYFAQFKSYQNKVDRMNAMKARIERNIEAIEEGQIIAQTGDVFGGIRDILEEISVEASPTKIGEIAEETEEYRERIEMSGELLAGDMEIDLGMEVTDEELDQLETEMLLDQSGEMPEVPSDELEYIQETPYDEEEPEIKSKEKLAMEIEKLRKELSE